MSLPAWQARPLSLWSPDEDSGKLASARSSLVAAAAPTSTAAAIPEEVQWWDEPKSPAYVHPRQKEQVGGSGGTRSPGRGGAVCLCLCCFWH